MLGLRGCVLRIVSRVVCVVRCVLCVMCCVLRVVLCFHVLCCVLYFGVHCVLCSLF